MNKQYSLSELCAYIDDALSAEFPDTYWVRAEIASLSVKSGHAYMELVEKSSANALPIAKIRATCWANVYTLLSAYFVEETGTALATGMQVLLEVSVSFHSVYGLSLNITGIDPRYTLGDIARQRLETINRLTLEGVIELQKAFQLPTIISRIAVISAESAAGYGDFCDQLYQSGFRFTTALFPAIMQGDNAERSILSALDAIALQEEEFDVVVIIRGGGATSDLQCFDAYQLSAACAQFPLPILTGIGHTRDVSVIDMVAHRALKTPTAVAAFLVERMNRQQEHINIIRRRLIETADRQIMIRRHRQELLWQRIESANPERIYRRGYSLTLLNGHVLRSADGAMKGQIISTCFADGTIESEIL